MATQATARRTASGRAAARRRPRRPARPARAAHTPPGGSVAVAAVGRTAGAFGGLADSGLVVRLARGRLWIGLLGVLLVGIVGLNVMALSFSSSSSNSGRAADDLSRLNSSLRGDIATKLSNDEVQAAATKLGLIVPEPGAIRYLEASADDAATAAQRLRDGELSSSGYVAPATTAVAAAPVTDSAAVAPVADTATVATEPVTESLAPPAPEVAAPTAPVTPVAEPEAGVSAGGGLTAP